MLAEKHSWIFDLDGTLTVAIHDFDAIRSMLGVPPGAGILEWLATLPRELRRDLEDRLDAHEYELARRASAAPGAHEVLRALTQKGCRLGIVTRNNARNVEHTLRAAGLGDYFHSADIMTRDATPPKPAPDGIAKLLTQWRSSPRAGVMVGNHLHDLAAGRAAGVTTVHVDVSGEFEWGHATDVAVTSLTELLSRTLVVTG